MREILISNARIVGPEHDFLGSLKIEGGRIVDILPHKFYSEGIDLGGQWLIPGCIDIHSDYIELELHPRPTSNFPLPFAMHFMDIRALACGITTLHNAISFSDEEHKNRSIEGSVSLAKEIDQQVGRLNARHFIHARLDPKCPNLEKYLKDIRSLSTLKMAVYNDHTPGERQYSMLNFVQAIMQKYRVSERKAKVLARRRLEELASINLRGKIQESMTGKAVLGSHDDTTEAHVEEAFAYGAILAEMPTTLTAIERAKELGMWTSLGAPNYFRGGSHCGNISCEEAMHHDWVDILCSDYHFPTLLGSFIKMIRRGMTPSKALDFISLNPATMLGIEADFGSIEVGKMADLVAFDVKTDFAACSHVWIEGKLVFQVSARSAYNDPPSSIPPHLGFQQANS